MERGSMPRPRPTRSPSSSPPPPPALQHQWSSCSSSATSVSSATTASCPILEPDSRRRMPVLVSMTSAIESPQSVDKITFSPRCAEAPEGSSSTVRTGTIPTPTASGMSPRSPGPLPPPPLRPRPEIILRWKRFLVLVVASVVALTGVAVAFVLGIPLGVVEAGEDVEAEVLRLNSYVGVVMGFVESIAGLLLGYLFPVAIVYLHNCRWGPGDDPGNRPTPRWKKLTLALFAPVAMIALGSSLSAVQTNQVGGDDDDGNDGELGARHRRLREPGAVGAILFEGTALHSVLWGVTQPLIDDCPLPGDVMHASPDAADGAQGTHDLDLGRVAAATRVVVDFHIPTWAHALMAPTATTTIVSEVPLDDSPTKSEIMGPDVALELLAHARNMLPTLGLVPTAEPGVAVEAITNHDRPAPSSWADVRASARSLVSGNHSWPIDATAVTLWLERAATHVPVEMVSLRITAPWQQLTDDYEIACDRETTTSTPAACVLLAHHQLLQLRQQSLMGPLGHGSSSAAFVLTLSRSMMTTATTKTTIPTIEWTLSRLSWGPTTTTAAIAFFLGVDSLMAQRRPRVPTTTRRLLEIVTPRVPRMGHSPVDRVDAMVSVESLDPIAAAATASQSQDDSHCEFRTSRLGMAGFGRFIHTNHLTLAEPTRSAYAAALLAIFVGSSPQSQQQQQWRRQRRGLAATSPLPPPTTSFEVYIKNTTAGAAFTWTACGLLAVLSLLVLLVPNARARLEPPRGGNARAERFIAVQTEEIYPNLVYKKRFRIGHTGEKIKFREFAVERVRLHHLLDEDERVEL